MNHSELLETIKFIRPGATFVLSGSEVEWLDEDQTEPSLEEIENAFPKYLAKVEADKKAAETAKKAILDRLGITQEEARLILS